MDSKFQAKLQIGDVFTFDLLDNIGSVALAAGSEVTQEVLDRLQATGTSRLFVGPSKEESDNLAAAIIEGNYNSSHTNALASIADDAPELLLNVASELSAGHRIDGETIDFLVAGYEAIANEDPDVVLAHAMADAQDNQVVPLRSLRMCAMSVVGATRMGVSKSDRRQVGRAALLHDISLPLNWPELLTKIRNDPRDSQRALEEYGTHPFRSADLLRSGLVGVTDLELTIVTQVHEQCDGTGFPRKHKRHILHPLSRLVNVVDAYLTLTDDSHPDGGIMPADALAYLVLHALYGAFDRDCVQALVRSAAVYPVGSEVKLSNNETGTVMRSRDGDYLRPIVRLHTPESETLDLSRSQHHIVEPVGAKGKRLSKSRIHKPLWRTF
ncbi:MAG: HD-GYP domain-containing protein [Aureliella sp.]